MKRAVSGLLLLLAGVMLSGCIVAPPYGYYAHPRPGYCYYHPYRC